MDNILKKLKEELRGVKFQELLSQHTNFKIGGPADYFYKACNTQDIIQAVRMARFLDLPYYILGWGSNVLVSDQGFRGLVIEVASKNWESRDKKIICEAGVSLGDLVKFSLDNNLEGLESLTDIPGTVGGALYGNAGAFGRTISDIVEKVKVLNPANLAIETYSKEDCQFAYRDSIFKKNKKIILEAALNLRRIKNRKELQEKIKRIKEIRKKHPSRRCAGSIFKNIKIKDISWEVQKKVPEDCCQFDEIKVACLIDELRLKGEKQGDAQVSKKHANFIINRGEAKAQDVLDLIDFVKKKVYKEYGLRLKIEIQLVGFEGESQK